jgi:hypothetical protein
MLVRIIMHTSVVHNSVQYEITAYTVLQGARLVLSYY